MKLHVLGIDLGKTVFHLVGLDSTGKAVIRKKCSRRQLGEWISIMARSQ
jgi:transposase